MFPEYEKLNLNQICSEINDFWEKEDVFNKSITSRSEKNRFVFFEGPPSANGLPGIHHVMARLIKDIFCRYKTLSGFRVDRKAGWDTHGLPIELSVEKELGIKKDDIGGIISVEDYNAACKKTVMKYTDSWNRLTNSMGYWVDVTSPYITYKNKYIESVWFLLKTLFDKNLIYKGHTIQPYSPAAGTGLSSHELNQPGCYKMVKDLSVIVLFRVVDFGELIGSINKINHLKKDVFFVAWTTTPWTLFANTGLAVGKSIKYVVVETTKPHNGEEVLVVCAEECLSFVFNNKQNPVSYKVLQRFSGSDLVGLKYEQLLKYVQPSDPKKEAFRVIDADFVNTDGGTGVVHLAPTFGADDFLAAKKHNLPSMLVENGSEKPCPVVDLNGRFIDGLGPFSGRFVKSAFGGGEKNSVDVDIVVMLKKEGSVFRSEKYEHSYPHCWRTDKPILYYPLDSWFIQTTKYKEELIKKNEEINWKPKSTGEGRFQNWLENLNDWNLSRSRFWGIPLPIWKTESGNHIVCVGSVEELQCLCEESVLAGNMKKNPLEGFKPEDMSEENYELFDLHKNCVDNIVLTAPSGEPMYRESDVIDVWFDSGAMPYAQWHYPFENKELVDDKIFYPADFIAEGVDQTRGWFFTLHAISVMCFGSIAFKNVISNGLVLDHVGQKMSKRLGNGVDPFEVINNHGADAVRWYMITNSQPWDNLKFNLDGVVEVKQKLFGTLYNIYSFFSLYANIDQFQYSEKNTPLKDRPILDQWILSELNTLVSTVEKNYKNYEPTLVGRALQGFIIDKLSNWYVRLCRRRFWRGEYDLEKISAYQTLYECLITVAKLAAPIAPFFMDWLFLNLNRTTNNENACSVHISSFPISSLKRTQIDLEKKMGLTKTICSLALSLRKKEKIRVRQPLNSVTVCLSGGLVESDVLASLVLSEVNVKDVFFVKNSNKMVKKTLSINFPVLGKKYGKKIKSIKTLVDSFSEAEVENYENCGRVELCVDNETIVLSNDDLIIKMENVPGFLTAKSTNVLISLDTSISQELALEGVAREFINQVQNIRKEQNLSVVDRVYLEFSGTPDVVEALEKHEKYISGEVLADKITHVIAPPKNNTLFEFNNYKMYIAIVK